MRKKLFRINKIRKDVRGGGLKGFTLVELMIVITVIAILATLGVMSFTRVQMQARDVKRKADVRAIETALQAYFTEFSAYPAARDTLVPTYIPVFPVPPKGASQTAYSYNTDTNTKYAVCAVMETQGTANTIWKVSAANPGGYVTNDTDCVAE